MIFHIYNLCVGLEMWVWVDVWLWGRDTESQLSLLLKACTWCILVVADRIATYHDALSDDFVNLLVLNANT